MEDHPKKSTVVQRIRIRNAQPSSVKFGLEPWAEEVVMPANGIIRDSRQGP